MGKTVRQLLSEIDSRELSEWMAYDQINPPPDPWLQTGLLCAILENRLGVEKKVHKPEQYMPRRKRAIDDSPEQERAQKLKLDRYFGRLLGKEK